MSDAAFRPARVYFEPRALDYPLGQELYDRFRKLGTEIKMTASNGRVLGIPGDDFRGRYLEAKRTLVVGVRQSHKFQTSKPSADYQLPLVTGCSGHCQYCYLNTNLGLRNYIRIYVNVPDILGRAAEYIKAGKGEGRLVSFDGSCTGDPVATEPWTGALAATIRFFAGESHGRFRFVTKYTAVDGLLDLPHAGHTRIRFSINVPWVIGRFEKGVAGLKGRIEAAGKVAAAGYPTGFIIGPIMLFENWQDDYARMFAELSQRLKPPPADLTFELITHRFTARAKAVIAQAYPDNELPMAEAERQFRWGQFGYGKYLYKKEDLSALRSFLCAEIARHFPQAKIDYFV